MVVDGNTFANLLETESKLDLIWMTCAITHAHLKKYNLHK